MTQTGTVLGTSDYIAPEQAQGQRVDEHTDVYSLGVVLYEMLLDEVPFPGENFVAVAMRHINEEPPSIRERRPDVPPRVEAAVHRAMAKDPQARFPTMGDFCAGARGMPRRGGGHAGHGGRCSAASPGACPPPWPVPVAAHRRALRADRDRRRGRLPAHRRPPSWVTSSTGVGGGGGSGTPSGAVPHLQAVDGLRPVRSDGQRTTPMRRRRPTAIRRPPGRPSATTRPAPSLGKPGVGLVLDAGQARAAPRSRLRHGDARLHRGDPRRRLGRRPVRRHRLRLPVGDEADAVRDPRRQAPLLPDLDHEPRHRPSTRCGSTRSAPT